MIDMKRLDHAYTGGAQACPRTGTVSSAIAISRLRKWPITCRSSCRPARMSSIARPASGNNSPRMATPGGHISGDAGTTASSCAFADRSATPRAPHRRLRCRRRKPPYDRVGIDSGHDSDSDRAEQRSQATRVAESLSFWNDLARLMHSFLVRAWNHTHPAPDRSD